MLDIYAPIVPYAGAGGFQLYSSIAEVSDELKKIGAVREKIGADWIRYTIEDKLMLFFNQSNNILFKITTLPGYKGKLFDTIGTDTTEKEFQRMEPSFVYDDFEEVFESPKGAFIETDVLEHTASWISVFVKELVGYVRGDGSLC